MNKNQDRIEGEWAIVSTRRSDEVNDGQFQDAESVLVELAYQGIPAELVFGTWNGVRELSLRLHGPGSLKAAAKVALDYDQAALIHAKGGVAYLHPVEKNYARGKAFTRMVEVADTEADDYTELGNGFKFRLLP